MILYTISDEHVFGYKIYGTRTSYSISTLNTFTLSHEILIFLYLTAVQLCSNLLPN